MAIDSSDNYIDPRDVQVEADEYEDSIACKQEEIEDARNELMDADAVDEQVEIEGRISELESELVGLEEEAEDIFELRDDCSNFPSGEALVNEDYWVQHVQQLAEDMDGINIGHWPYNNINWEDAAEDLKVDYSTITWRGQDFYIRN